MKQWFERPPITGWWALLCALLALSLATIIRAVIDGIVTGCEFTPYLPFVFLTAVLLRWWQATIIALLSVVVLGTLFMGPPHTLLSSACFLSSAGIFLAASAGMILFVMIFRDLLRAFQRSGEDESAGGVVFSLEDGEVWASWYGQGPPVLLGSEPKVSTMMEGFLAQVEVGKRLNGDRH